MGFKQIFQRIRNQYQILRFFYTHIAFWNFFFFILALLQTLNAKADERGQKREFFPYKCVLELNFATINGLREPIC